MVAVVNHSNANNDEEECTVPVTPSPQSKRKFFKEFPPGTDDLSSGDDEVNYHKKHCDGNDGVEIVACDEDRRMDDVGVNEGKCDEFAVIKTIIVLSLLCCMHKSNDAMDNMVLAVNIVIHI